jgi:hypothetical protein
MKKKSGVSKFIEPARERERERLQGGRSKIKKDLNAWG